MLLLMLMGHCIKIMVKVSGNVMKLRTLSVIMTLAVAMLLSAMIFLNLIFINIDSYKSLKVSDSKETTLQNLYKDGVVNVTPEQVEYIEVTGADVSNEAFSNLRHYRELCLTDSKGLFLELGFSEEDFLESLNGTASAKNPRIKLGISRENAESYIRDLMKIDPATKAWNCIINHKWVNIQYASKTDVSLLLKYNKWSFGVSDSHSTIDLLFRDGILHNIRYNYRYFEGI